MPPLRQAQPPRLRRRSGLPAAATPSGCAVPLCRILSSSQLVCRATKAGSARAAVRPWVVARKRKLVDHIIKLPRRHDRPAGRLLTLLYCREGMRRLQPAAGPWRPASAPPKLGRTRRSVDTRRYKLRHPEPNPAQRLYWTRDKARCCGRATQRRTAPQTFSHSYPSSRSAKFIRGCAHMGLRKVLWRVTR